MRRILALGFVFMFGLVALPGASFAADAALVIGNNDYRNAPDARSAANDARAVAEALEDGGYKVTLGIDLKGNEMRREIGRFARRMRDADRVVIFYSGHAQRSDGITYLAPVDQQGRSLTQVMMDGVPLDLLLRLARRKPGKAVVFIDAAQLDGFEPTRFAEPGLADIQPGDGVLVVSAAAPGQALRRRGERESRFARQIIRNFLAPGVRVSEAVRDIRRPTWVTGNANPRLVLVPRGRGRVGSSEPAARTPAQIEDALGLTRAQRRGVQQNLSDLGFDPRGIDGAFGPGTRTAVRLWQRRNSAAETGYMTAEQVALLDSQANEVTANPGRQDDDYWARTGARGSANGYRDYLSRYSDGLHAAEARDALRGMARAGTDAAAVNERRDWRAANRSDRAADYRDYIARYPTGIWLPEAEDRLAGLGTAPAPVVADPQDVETALGLSRNDRLSVEQRLNRLGFRPGNIDGFFDGTSRWAIEGYQRSRGHPPTGYLDQPTIVNLLDETGGNQPGIVIDGAAVLRGLLGGN